MNRSGPPRNGSTPDWSRGSLNRQNEKSRRQNITDSQFVVELLCVLIWSHCGFTIVLAIIEAPSGAIPFWIVPLRAPFWSLIQRRACMQMGGKRGVWRD